MKRPKQARGMIWALACILFVNTAFTQGNWEVKMVQSINPRYPSDRYFNALSGTAKPIAITIPFCMIATALITENRKLERNAYEVAASMVVASIVTEGLKKIVNRPRPYQKFGAIYPDEIDNSSCFPSGHTSIAFSLATSLTLTSKKWYIAIPAFTWASAVGYSRMYLGQHYPSDILAGAVVGIGSGWLTHWLNKKLFFSKKREL